jgi:hypothetical protein
MSSTLPTWDELMLADYKIGSFTSDLVDMASSVQHFMAPVPLEDALWMDRHGIAVSEDREVDLTLLLRLVAFATSALDDAERIAEDARQIQKNALALYYEHSGSRDLNPDGWDSYRRCTREWHREEANRA